MSSEVKIFGAILVAAIALVAFAVVPTLKPEKSPLPDHPVTIKDPELTKSVLVPKGSHIRGNEDAKYVLVTFSDFQCPQCMKSAPLIEELYQKNKDKLALVYHNFQARTDHFNSKTLDQAAEAAGLQGKFWEMHDILFKNQDKLLEPDKDKTVAQIDTLAKSIGLDMVKFKADVNSKEATEAYAKDNELALTAKARATPWSIGIAPDGRITYLPKTDDIKTWLADGLPKPAPRATVE
ncbi:MAG: thioredoxin domain-containing protein [Chthonomonadales bacterium]